MSLPNDSTARSVALFGMGMFYYFVSLVPKSFHWAIKLIGFAPGNCVLGRFFQMLFIELFILYK